jgi:hypothetical protein
MAEIARAGKPLVKVVPLDAPPAGEVKWFDFMAGTLLSSDPLVAQYPAPVRMV